MGIRFNIGDKVTWPRKSGGQYAGVVVAVVPAGMTFSDAVLLASQTPVWPKDWRTNFYGDCVSRQHESYLVVTPGETSRALPRLHWPRPNQLQAAG